MSVRCAASAVCYATNRNRRRRRTLNVKIIIILMPDLNASAVVYSCTLSPGLKPSPGGLLEK